MFLLKRAPINYFIQFAFIRQLPWPGQVYILVSLFLAQCIFLECLKQWQRFIDRWGIKACFLGCCFYPIALTLTIFQAMKSHVHVENNASNSTKRIPVCWKIKVFFFCIPLPYRKSFWTELLIREIWFSFFSPLFFFIQPLTKQIQQNIWIYNFAGDVNDSNTKTTSIIQDKTTENNLMDGFEL